jgi:hypothetical protein
MEKDMTPRSQLLANLADLYKAWQRDLRQELESVYTQMEEAMEEEGVQETISKSGYTYKKLDEPKKVEYQIRRIERVDTMKEKKDETTRT